MNEKKHQWVQHISGQGKKWEVFAAYDDRLWIVNDSGLHQRPCLPRSEYVLCDPPENWVDVTQDISFMGTRFEHGEDGHFAWCEGKYRARKVKLYKSDPSAFANCIQWAFIIERKEPS